MTQSPPSTVSVADIRKTFLDFFESKGHRIISGASLIPENDPTVLFTTAGMHPLVPFLLEGFADKRELFQADNLHPTAEAQAMMLETIWKTLAPIIKVK
jgi:alanyl-tRNA synthetase